MSDFLTICVLTYNRPNYLLECLKSIQAQTFAEYRLVVLDNASESSYASVLSKCADPRLEYVRHPQNLGSVGNFTFAQKHFSDSKYLMIFHDDDLMHCSLLERQIALLEADERLQFVGCQSMAFRGRPPVQGNPLGSARVFRDASDLAVALMNHLPLHFGSVMYRGSALSSVSFDFARFSIIGDRPLLFDLAQLGRCAVLNGFLVYYRDHSGQDSKTGPVHERNLIELYKAYRTALGETCSLRTRVRYYAWTGVETVDTYRHLSAEKRSPMHEYFGKCRDARIISWPFLLCYPIGRLVRHVNRRVTLFRRRIVK